MKRVAERGFTLVEIMIVVAIIALLAAIAIPNVLRGRTTANESAAIGNMRALISGHEMFRSVNNVYPTTGSWGTGGAGLTMFPPAPTPAFGPPNFGTAAIGATLAGDVVQGFQYTYAAVPAACTDAALDCGQYTLLVQPQTVNQTGTRSFFTNETGIITHCPAAVGALGTAANGPTWATIDQPADAVPGGPINNCT